MKESRLCRACEIQANDEQVKQMPMHTCGKDGPIERAEPKDQSTPIAMEPTKDRITPEQFYSESKWPEMKDKFDKSALLFHYYDLCQFANDYAQQELQAYRDIIKELIPIAERCATMATLKMETSYAYKSTISKARKLIDTVTPTSNPEQS